MFALRGFYFGRFANTHVGYQIRGYHQSLPALGHYGLVTRGQGGQQSGGHGAVRRRHQRLGAGQFAHAYQRGGGNVATIGRDHRQFGLSQTGINVAGPTLRPLAGGVFDRGAAVISCSRVSRGDEVRGWVILLGRGRWVYNYRLGTKTGRSGQDGPRGWGLGIGVRVRSRLSAFRGTALHFDQWWFWLQERAGWTRTHLFSALHW